MIVFRSVWVGVSASPTGDGVVSALAVKGNSCLADSLRSPWTARPETKTWLVVGEAEVSGRLRLSGRLLGCRTAVHSLFRGLVLGAPAVPFSDGGEEDAGVGVRVGFGVGPEEPGLPVRGQRVGGEPFDLGGEDACGEEGLPDDVGTVGLVAGQRFTGPLPGDEDASAAEAEVLPVVRL